MSDPEVDRLRAEVERLVDRALSAEEDAAHWRDAFGSAEDERDDLRARLAKVEALADQWDAEADQLNRSRHMITELRAVLASVPEPSAPSE